MTGIAAILHYAIQFPDFSDDEDSLDSDDDEANNKFYSHCRTRFGKKNIEAEL